MKFVLEIAMDNAAFEEPFATDELIVILRKAVGQLAFGAKENDGGTLMDSNGNSVGHWAVVSE